MKTGIHPTYHSPADISCANCGAKFQTGAAKAEIRVEICSKCHPFYTGKKMLIDTEGRVDKFMKQMESATGVKKKERKKKTLEERVNEQLADQMEKAKK
jgi:large subunit ribosomal protein L31